MKHFVVAMMGLVCLSVDAQTKPVRPAITGISHFIVLDSDLAAAKHFYGDVIGWPESTPLDKTAAVHFQVGPRQYIEVKISPEHQPEDRVETIAFETADVKKLRTYLIANGVEPTPVEKHSNGTLAITVHDPDGYRVEFDQGGTFAAPGKAAISTHLIHMGFDTRNADAMKHFYLEVLGFKPYWHGWRDTSDPKPGEAVPMDDYKSIQVPDGTDWVELMLADGRKFPVGTARNPHHFAPGVVSVAAAYELVKQRDPAMAAVRKVQDGRDGKGQLNLFDPSHTRVEFMDFQPHAKPCCSDFTADSPKPE